MWTLIIHWVDPGRHAKTIRGNDPAELETLRDQFTRQMPEAVAWTTITRTRV